MSRKQLFIGVTACYLFVLIGALSSGPKVNSIIDFAIMAFGVYVLAWVCIVFAFGLSWVLENKVK